MVLKEHVSTNRDKMAWREQTEALNMWNLSAGFICKVANNELDSDVSFERPWGGVA